MDMLTKNDENFVSENKILAVKFVGITLPAVLLVHASSRNSVSVPN